MTKNGIMDNNVKHTESKINSLTRIGGKRQTDPERYMRNKINCKESIVKSKDRDEFGEREWNEFSKKVDKMVEERKPFNWRKYLS